MTGHPATDRGHAIGLRIKQFAAIRLHSPKITHNRLEKTRPTQFVHSLFATRPMPVGPPCDECPRNLENNTLSANLYKLSVLKSDRSTMTLVPRNVV